MATGNRKDSKYIKTLAESAAIWSFLHDLFRFPDEYQWQWLNEYRVKQAWAIIRQRVSAKTAKNIPLPESREIYELDYISAFEVGTPEPPCPLIESHWNKSNPVPKILRENILFYRQFGLTLRSASDEAADGLRFQLEFIYYLCRMEMEAADSAKNGVVTSSIRQGRRDFLDRHLNSWVPRAAEKYNRKNSDVWTAAWMTLLAACCRFLSLAE